MRFFKKLLFTIIVILILAIAGGYIFLKGTAPQYSGELKFNALKDEVKIYYDNYGIPHIYANNEEDAYFALGYVHAQDRLFQMEMIRRVTSGRLAEFLGEDVVEIDKLFRTLGIREKAELSAKEIMSSREKPFQKAAFAYLDGINSFIGKGNLPIEYTLLNLPKEKFTPAHIFALLGFMNLGFTWAIEEEPIVTEIKNKFGEEYLKDLKLWYPKESTLDSITQNKIEDATSLLSYSIEEKLKEIGVPVWSGSNAWVIAPEHSKSGKVLLANDTHIGFSQPSIFYEAHLEYPGFSFYGNYLAGIPFGVVGHNKKIAWGLTIFPIDNMDFYQERQNPDNPDQVWENDKWVTMKKRREVIKVKGKEDIVFDVKITRHGPVLNEVKKSVSKISDQPVSLWWAFHKFNSETVEAVYLLNNSQNIDEVQKLGSKIDIIGMNVVYGDIEGNIAWWGCGKIPIKPPHVNSRIFLDGASGKDEVLGFYDFSENPHLINPPSGFIASANNDPSIVNVRSFAGYYLSENRILRLIKLLSEQEKWSLDEMKKIHKDVKSDAIVELLKIISGEISGTEAVNKSEINKKAFEILANWDGNYYLESTGAVIYSKFIYHLMQNTMEDEIGKESFERLSKTYLLKLSVSRFIKDEYSVWWDNVNTTDLKENRKAIFAKAFIETMESLREQLGDDILSWKWKKVHTLTHEHPIGKKKPFDKVFNVGPFPVPGGSGVINKLEAKGSNNGIYKVNSGAALRVLLDFADIENSISINPTGQSGNIMSSHYKDQARMFVNGEYRKQMMNKEEILKKAENILVLKPKK